MTPERYPLTWPVGQPRCKYRHDSRFKVQFARSRDDLLRSLALLGGTGVIISSNLPLRQDGLPYANCSEPVDPGVAIYFDRRIKGERKPYTIACDTYRKTGENLRAILVTVEALRDIDRHGASTMLEQAFAGFAALPAAGDVKPWWITLGVAEYATSEVIRAAYRELTLIHHPDRGGDVNRMVEINEAMRLSGAMP
jgi:hypothetical protein